MRLLKKVFTVVTIASVLTCCTWIVSANNSTLHVGAYVSKMTGTSDYSQISGANHTHCYVKLTGFQFEGYSQNVYPLSPHSPVNFGVCLYSYNPGNNPSLSQATSTSYIDSLNGGGSYPYLSGYGNVGSKYRLKAYNGCDLDCSVTFYWYA